MVAECVQVTPKVQRHSEAITAPEFDVQSRFRFLLGQYGLKIEQRKSPPKSGG